GGAIEGKLWVHDFVLDTLEQALHARRPHSKDATHPSERNVRHVSICYTKRLRAADIGASVGSVCDSCDNALAKTINDL
ncbi:ISPsy21, transposase orfB, partial [mine drainage metagenome]